jgi:hypothetical protein
MAGVVMVRSSDTCPAQGSFSAVLRWISQMCALVDCSGPAWPRLIATSILAAIAMQLESGKRLSAMSL